MGDCFEILDVAGKGSGSDVAYSREDNCENTMAVVNQADWTLLQKLFESEQGKFLSKNSGH